MGRAPCCDKANVKKGPWSPEEDAKLKAYIEQNGTGGNWIALPQKIGLKRYGKSCRLRWLNYLRPDIKHGGFTEEEDNTICSLYLSIGSRWSIIAAQLPGRTDNDIKNYWNAKLKKKLFGRRKQATFSRFSSDPNEGKYPDDSTSSETLSNSALERLQLHMQLQGLQGPFSLYNDPPFRPKMHPLQQKLIQNMMLNNYLQLPHNQMPDFASLHQNDPTSIINNSKGDDHVSSSNGMPSSSGSSECLMNNLVEEKSDFMNMFTKDQSDLGIPTMLNNSEFDYMFQENQLGELNYFKEVDSYKESSSWWANPWDSTSMLQAEGMIQDYGLDSCIQRKKG